MTTSSAPTTVLLVAVGGFVGTFARYGIDVIVVSSLASTLVVNVVGSFALATVFFGNQHGDLFGTRMTLLVATGFLSSFTTYSTFVIDAVFADPLIAGAYVMASYLLGFSAAMLGRLLGRRLRTNGQPLEGYH